MKSEPLLVVTEVHCRTGSLEMTKNAPSVKEGVHCRTSSLEKSGHRYRGAEIVHYLFHCRFGTGTHFFAPPDLSPGGAFLRPYPLNRLLPGLPAGLQSGVARHIRGKSDMLRQILAQLRGSQVKQRLTGQQGGPHG